MSADAPQPPVDRRDAGPGSPAGGPAAPPPPPPGQESANPLRQSRTSGAWVGVGVLVVLLILLAIFVLQNTQSVEVSYFGWTGDAPLAAALLIATVAGMVVAGTAGALRIIQLRRRVKRELR